MGERSEGARAEPQGTEAEQPSSDRRESARMPVELLIRDLALGGSFEPKRGNLALGGVFYDDLHPPAGDRMEVRFLLPGVPGLRQPIHALAEVIEAVPEGEVFGVRLRFVDISIEDEMAVARCLQG
jgi:hypothetical protein